jgi:hypothetical protein
MPQAPNTLSHSAKQSKLARVLPFPKPKHKARPQKPLSLRVGRTAVLQSAIRDRLRAYRGDDPAAFEWRGWVLG